MVKITLSTFYIQTSHNALLFYILSINISEKFEISTLSRKSVTTPFPPFLLLDKPTYAERRTGHISCGFVETSIRMKDISFPLTF